MFNVEMHVFVPTESKDGEQWQEQLVRLVKLPFAPVPGMSLFVNPKGDPDHGAYYVCGEVTYDIERESFEVHYEWTPPPRVKGLHRVDWRACGFREYHEVFPTPEAWQQAGRQKKSSHRPPPRRDS